MTIAARKMTRNAKGFPSTGRPADYGDGGVGDPNAPDLSAAVVITGADLAAYSAPVQPAYGTLGGTIWSAPR